MQTNFTTGNFLLKQRRCFQKDVLPLPPKTDPANKTHEPCAIQPKACAEGSDTIRGDRSEFASGIAVVEICTLRSRMYG